MQYTLLITCEHGGNRVPRGYEGLFAGAERVLASHRGYDPGALELARGLARHLGVPLISATVTRLLIDLNRSLNNRAVFSEYSRVLDEAARAQVVERFYRPYRDQVEAAVAKLRADSQEVRHFSMHSFTPVRRGVRRRADVGLLFDPRRPAERQLARAWQAALRARRPGLIVRRNYPYLGIADGFTTHLRKAFGARYAGIELEVNQKWVKRATWPTLQRDLIETLAAIL